MPCNRSASAMVDALRMSWGSLLCAAESKTLLQTVAGGNLRNRVFPLAGSGSGVRKRDLWSKSRASLGLLLMTKNLIRLSLSATV